MKKKGTELFIGDKTLNVISVKFCVIFTENLQNIEY